MIEKFLSRKVSKKVGGDAATSYVYVIIQNSGRSVETKF
jgi:hypothetical protein